MSKSNKGFTIVELLVVIVVIGILAAITIIAYSGITQRAAASTLQSDLKNASTQLELYKAEHDGYPPDNQSTLDGLPKSDNTEYDYTVSSDNQTYYLTASLADDSDVAYYTTVGGGIVEGAYVGDGWKTIATGENHACGIGMDDYVYCWGANNVGQLGDGTNTPRTAPTLVDVDGMTVSKIAAGMSHTCAIASNNNAYCWGNNQYGQLGDDSIVNKSSPTAVNIGATSALNGKTVLNIVANTGHTCVIASDNKGYCWGLNGYGQLGDSSTNARDIPVAVSGGLTLSKIANGGQHTCAIASDNYAYCWGNNGMGQLGDDTTSPRSVPTSVNRTGLIAGKTVTDITAGSNDSCLVTSEGKGYCWGENWNGQLGNGTTSPADVPTLVVDNVNLSGKSLVSIRAGGMHTCGLTSDDKTYCWGWGLFGQLGDDQTNDRLAPVAVLGGLESLTTNSISSGLFFSCAVTSDNSAYCWGHNASSQLGDGTAINRDTPVIVAIP